MILPFWFRIKIRDKNKKGINLHIPLLLPYLILLPFVILLIPVWLLVSLFTIGTTKGRMIFYIVPASYNLLCAARGTEIYVKEKKSEVILRIV